MPKIYYMITILELFNKKPISYKKKLNKVFMNKITHMMKGASRPLDVLYYVLYKR